MSTKHAAADFFTLPVELWSIRDLTDALGIDKAAELLNTTRRVMYVTRSKSNISLDRLRVLIAAVRENETACRSSLVLTRNRNANRTAA